MHPLLPSYRKQTFETPVRTNAKLRRQVAEGLYPVASEYTHFSLATVFLLNPEAVNASSISEHSSDDKTAPPSETSCILVKVWCLSAERINYERDARVNVCYVSFEGGKHFHSDCTGAQFTQASDDARRWECEPTCTEQSRLFSSSEVCRQTCCCRARVFSTMF